MERYIALESIPSWYKTPRAQTIALGVVFLLLFAAYKTIQFYAASTYGPTIAANSISALYATFTLGCFVSPSVTNKWGARNTLSIGIMGYVSLVVFSLLYFQGYCGSWGVILGGVLLGMGAALLWTAQGKLILQYAAEADRQKKNSSSDEGTQGSESGQLLGTFWAVFQCSSLVGGAISFSCYYHAADSIEQTNAVATPSVNLYLIFLGLILLSAMLSQLLLPPSSLGFLQTDGKNSEAEETMEIDEQSPLLQKCVEETSNNKQTELPGGQEEDSWMDEAKGTLSLFANNRSIQILALIFFYTGYNQPYQQATFTRFLSKRAIGLEQIIFHAMAILGAIVCGRLLDRKRRAFPESGASSSDNAPRVAIQSLTIFLIVNMLGNLIALGEEMNNDESVIVDIASPWATILRPSLAFACWGWADSQIQVYSYWLMGRLFSSSTHDFSSAVAFYKCLESLGYTVGFYLTPTNRLGAMQQLTLSSIVCLTGTALAFLVLPPRR
ncbi:Ion channel regulatory protein UNC-93 [Seminavis robusta]|uniref:Ion channel regulatory protein UNC-93 n=1 Tax=Seminavis robusta TaxID=568900 RepID=A0A9N8ECP9_9STRA|nr:Ion channel regulatory protein UNC-93 [Seminavis robusta]|eukprot:Sro753_g197450.1 Ion channel regulatory protein UNC-93 (498) ;mRNA; r:40867-42448